MMWARAATEIKTEARLPSGANWFFTEFTISQTGQINRCCAHKIYFPGRLLYSTQALPKYVMFRKELSPKANTEKKSHNSTPQHPPKRKNNRFLVGNVLLERTEERMLLLLGLETSVTELGGGIDPLEVDLLEGLAGSVGEERFAEGHDALLDTGARALDHDEIVADLTISGETTKGCLKIC